MNNLPKITFGGYQNENEKLMEFYNSSINKIITHRVQGSFHWSLQLNKVIIGDNYDYLIPSVTDILTDTGTTMIIVYYKDLEIILNKLCEYI